MLINFISERVNNRQSRRYASNKRKLRYNRYIMNLAIKVFLFERNPDNFNVEKSNNISLPSDIKFEKWRQLGPLGKLYNIVIFIMRTP